MRRHVLTIFTALLAGCPAGDADDDTATVTASQGSGNAACGAHDQCRKDSECSGDNVCIECACVAGGNEEGSEGGTSGPSSAEGPATDEAGSADETGGGAGCKPDDVCMAHADCIDGGTCVGCTCVGTPCAENAECQSGVCFVLGILGGVCSQCLTDADCAEVTGGGCSLPNPLASPPVGALCNLGALGDGCMSDAVCQAGVCALLLDIPGIAAVSTCSECEDDAGCSVGTVCSPTYGILDLSGSKSCVAAGSVQDGGHCDLLGSGDAACTSGHCAAASVMGVVELGVCSACESDADCPGQTCIAPELDAEGNATPGACG